MKTTAFVAHFEQCFPDLVGAPIAVALSGGRDSVALLHLLRDSALDLELSAVHVHHELRGVESDGDADFCRRLCRNLAVPLSVVRLPRDDQRPRGGEAAWRRRRYSALIDHKNAGGLRAIATAHHRDDVAEGVLLQLLRGAGPRAMAGIAQRTDAGVIRPLLPWTRDDITAWLADRRISWCEDSSNADVARLRNRVRHDLLPRLEEASPRLRNHLVHLAGAIAEGESFMAAELEGRIGFIDPWDPTGGVDLGTLEALPRALRSRWLHGQMARLGPYRTTRRQLEHFHSLLDRGSPRSITMAARWRLRSARGRLWAEPPTAPTAVEARIDRGPPTSLGVPGLEARIGRPDEPHPDANWRWRPQSDHSIITVRSCRRDDRLPAASGGMRRVSDLLAQHLPRHLRGGWPLFCEDDMIHWIPGVWQCAKPGDPSNRVVEVIRQ